MTGPFVSAFARLRGTAWPGRVVVARLRPDSLTAIDQLEADAEAVARAHRAGSVPLAAVEGAVARWEQAIRSTTALVNNLCHDCGREAPFAAADPATGERFCAACAQLPSGGSR